MIEVLIPLVISNVIVAALLACIAWAVHRTHRYPAMAHVLWVLVLIKLLSPPLFTIPAIAVPTGVAEAGASSAPEIAPALTGHEDIVASMTGTPVLSASASESDRAMLQSSLWVMTEVPAPNDQTTTVAPQASEWFLSLQRWGVGLWLFGSVIALAWSGRRIVQFHRLLDRSASAADAKMQHLVDDLAPRFNVPSTPRVRLTSARIAPLVWWVGGRPSILIPTVLAHTLPTTELRLILAHELAHLKRRDHIVRWVEWLVCITFWWNPIAWWACRNLRANEEICCDALVVRTLSPQPRCYAASLLHVIEHLTSSAPVRRPPAVVSAMNGSGGGTLERRFRMIMSNTHTHRPSRLMSHGLLVLIFACLPLGLAYGQNYKAVERKLGEAVAEGDLSLEQAMIMMKALKQSAAEATHTTETDDRKRSKFERAEKDLRNAHAAGLIQEKDLELSLKALNRKQMAAEEEQAAQTKSDSGPRGRAEQTGEDVERAARQMQEARRAVADLEALVNAGQISQEDMDARVRAMRQRMRNARAEQRPAPPAREMQMDLRRAVAERVREIDRLEQAGELSPEAARARRDALYERARRASAEAQATSNQFHEAAADAMMQAGIPREHLRPAMSAMERLVIRHHEEGSAFELGPQARDYFADRLQMNEQQIDLMVSLSKRLWHQRLEAVGGIAPQKFEAASRELRSMVDDGTISHEEADAKRRELRRALDAGNRAIHGERARGAANPDRPAARARPGLPSVPQM